MADFRTIVARTGFVDQMIARFENTSCVSADGQWVGLVAEDEADAITEATEKFDNDAHMSDWVVGLDSTEVWEVTGADGETVIGWKANADGYPQNVEY